MMLPLLASVALATSIDQVPNPRARGGWVTDQAGILDEGAEARLDARIEALHADLGVEIAVVTVETVEGTPKEFATGLFARWQIGDRETNNGLLVLLVAGARRLEMETGYGLEPVLPDGWLGTMQQQVMVPHFKQGDYAAGLERGLESVDKKLRASPEEVRAGAVASSPSPWPMVGVGAVGVLSLGLIVGFVVRDRRRQRTCDACGIYMPMLDEVADDAHLDAGQQVEERIGAIDWQVHVCPQCSAVRTFARERWFSGYQRCPQCSRKARTSSTTTLQHATQYSGGLVEITEQCAHCSFHRRYTRSTPQLPPPSTTSSSSSSGGFSGGGGSSGGSFGGGSSGGGGAGSSW